jgi:hypothetical protein
MPEDEAHRLLRHEEDSAEEDLESLMTTSPYFQRRNEHAIGYAQSANAKPPWWARTRHSRASLIRLFGPIRSLLYAITIRTTLTLGLLTLLLRVTSWTTKNPALLPTPKSESGPEGQVTKPAQVRPVESPIFKVRSAVFHSNDDFDAIVQRMCYNLRERYRNITLIYLSPKGVRDGTWFSPYLHDAFLTRSVATSISRPIHGEAAGTTCCKNSAPQISPYRYEPELMISRVDYSPPTLLSLPDEPSSFLRTSHTSTGRFLTLRTWPFHSVPLPMGPSQEPRSPGAEAR